ncbi:MAG: sulfatase [Kiritimatiellales bacterium]
MCKRLYGVFGLSSLLVGAASAQSVQKPNVIIILTDDLGYQDIGCFGASSIKTPNLDQMAEDGCRFTSFYAAASVCSPSRAGLLTGRYPERNGLHGVYFPKDDQGYPLTEIMLSQVLKEQGYATACIGKWHLGHLPDYLPTHRGFDRYFGIPYSNDMWMDPQNIPPATNIVLREEKTLDDYFKTDRFRKGSAPNQVPLMRNDRCVEWPAEQATLTRRYAEEGIRFIQSNKDRPFFLYLATAMPHVPLHASEPFLGKSARGLYGDCVEEIDWAVGEILQALKTEGLAEKTLVVFTSDNGPWLVQKENAGSALPLRDGKGSTYEGGQRVPCIMWWPKTIPAGTVFFRTVSSLDLFPTVSVLAGAALPSDRMMDGHNILRILKNPETAVSPWNVFCYETTALRAGPWKFRNGPLYSRYHRKNNPDVIQLFNLDRDIGETVNLADQYPEKVTQFREMLDAYRQTVAGEEK